MVLQKQIISIPLRGVAEHIDPKQVPLGGLLKLENGYQDKQGEIRKRNGFAKMTSVCDGPSSSFADGALGSVNSVHALGPTLLAFGRQKPSTSPGTQEEISCTPGFMQFVPGRSLWQQTGRGHPSEIAVSSGYPADNDRRQPAMAIGAKHIVYAWERPSAGAIMVAVVDKTTGTPVAQSTNNINFTNWTVARSPRVVWLETAEKFMVFYRDTNLDSIRFRTIPDATGIVSSATTLTPASTLADGVLDAIRLDGSNAVVAHEVTTSDRIYVHKVAHSSTGAAVWSTISAAGTVMKNAIGLVLRDLEAGTQEIAVLFQDLTAGQIHSMRLDTDGAIVTEDTAVSTVGDRDLSALVVRRLCGVKDLELNKAVSPNKTDSFWCMAEIEDATDQFIWVYARPVDGTGAGFHSSGRFWHCALVSRPFIHDSKPFLVVRYTTADQPSYYLIAPFFTGSVWKDAVVAKFMYPTAQVWADSSFWPTTLSDVAPVGSGKYEIAVLENAYVDEAGVAYDAVKRVTLDLNPPALPSARVGKGLVIGGGQMHYADGETVSELGFHIYPELGALGTAAGACTDGAHSIIAVYEWTDAFGQLHRSAPSEASSQTTAGGQAITVPVPPPVRSNKVVANGTNYDLNVAIFMTEAGGTVYYLAERQSAPAQSANTTSISVSISDANLILNEKLYTTGGVLDTFAPAPSSRMLVTVDRAFAIADDDRTALRYSKPFAAGVGPEFAGEFLQAVLPEPGEAIAEMDGRVFVLSPTSVYYFYGDGPSATGLGSFSLLQKLPSDVGAIDRTGVLTTKDGIYFRTRKGIYLLDRGLQLQPVGLPVEDTVSDRPVTSIVSMESSREVRFTLGGASAKWAVLNGEVGQWSVFTGLDARSGVIWDSVHVWVSSNGDRVYKQALGFQDDNKEIQLRIRTPWIHVGALGGYQRCREFQLLGTFKSPHNLVIDLYHDFDDGAEPVSVVFKSSDLQTVAGRPERCSVRPMVQKSSAFMLEIYDTDQSGTRESFALSAVTAEIGTKPRMRPLSPAQSK